MDQFTRLGKREQICLLLFTCNYVVSVWRGFIFLWVLGMGRIILLWQSLGLPYNYSKGWIWVLIASVPDLAYFLLSLIFILGSCTLHQCKAILLYNNSALYLHNLDPISCGIVYINTIYLANFIKNMHQAIHRNVRIWMEQVSPGENEISVKAVHLHTGDMVLDFSQMSISL